MKGPALFGVSVAAVIGLFATLVRPAMDEAATHRRTLLDARPGAVRTRGEVDRACDDLAGALGLVHGRDDPRKDRIERLLAELPVENRRDVGPGEVVFEIGADRVATLLDRVRRRGIPVLSALRAEAVKGGDHYRVTLRFAPVPAGFTTP